MEIVLYIIIGIAIGAVLGVLLSKTQKQSLATQVEVLKSRVGETENRSKAEKEALQAHQEDLLRAKEEEKRALLASKEEEMRKMLASKEQEHANVIAAQEKRHNEALQNLRATFEQTIEHLKVNMKAATEEMLKTRQQEFSDLSKKNMEDIVSPLNETIAKMQTAMQDYSEKQSEFSGSMKTNLDTIIRQTETARKSAEELTTALKHDNKVQGDYGEAILDELLSAQGFTRGIHYEVQYTEKDEQGRALKGEEGEGMRPDVIFHIDTVRDVIIDSKMSLTDFISFANAETAEERQHYLELHVKSIENQVKVLSQKSYFKYHKKTAGRMDYVIMFVPISAAWWEALRYKPSLWREAMEAGVYIADEQTLFAALRIIKLTWTQIAQVDSQKEIFELVNQMVDRVGQFLKHYKKIGESLKAAQAAYESGENKLTDGGQSIITTTKNLLKKGAQDSKKNPVSPFLDVDDIEQLPEPSLPEQG